METQMDLTGGEGSDVRGLESRDAPAARGAVVTSLDGRALRAPRDHKHTARTAGQIITISPFRCRMWEHHDRIESHITEESCKAEIESFSRHGQIVAVLGRALPGDPDHDVELIFGARRLFVARHLNLPLLVEVREMSDREAITAMDIENRQRADISPYERGLSYARWLRIGFFESQEDIARGLKVSSSHVSRLLKIARLPSVIIDAFGKPAEILEAWGLELMEALEDPARREQILQRARAIAKVTPRPRPEMVLGKLLSTSAKTPLQRRVRLDVVRGADSRPLFRIRYLERSVAFMIPSDRLSSSAVASIRSMLATVLADSTPGRQVTRAEK
jgi:ParB family chromosome partitioning protein